MVSLSMQFFDPASTLARSQLFHDLPINILQELAKSALRRTYRRGDVVVGWRD